MGKLGEALIVFKNMPSYVDLRIQAKVLNYFFVKLGFTIASTTYGGRYLIRSTFLV